jgi:uncharacterized protein YjbI with pentapeptide repeats
MANEEHLAILEQGVKAWNQWRKENPDTRPDLHRAVLYRANLDLADLSGADLSQALFPNGADLSEADLSGANLNEAGLVEANLSGADLGRADLKWANLILADLSRANLSGADLSGTVLCGAHLSRANLSGADLIKADLSEADLSGANLGWADLSTAILSGANVEGATIEWSVFGDVDLSVVKGLDKVVHIGPSTIGIDTIYKSKGKIPKVFLRGCGVPDTMITYIGSLVGQPIGYYSCFISYSSQDQELAERLHADLQDKGVRCWFAPEDLKIGDKFRTRIDEAIRYHDKLLLVLSEHSVNSKWVEKEVETAFDKETPDHTVLFPIRLDEAVMQTDRAWAADIRRTRHIGDFANWKDHDAYQKAFERLLRDLKAESAEASE